MEQLITGCERSGTKMLSKRIGEQLHINFTLENKHTIACFKYHQELQKWNKYKDEKLESGFINKFEKHTLNEEINIEFLKWVKEFFPNVKIYYIIRDGRNVVSSIINKVWAQENCEIIRYEDICDIISNPLTNEQLIETTNLIHHNLYKTNYNL